MLNIMKKCVLIIILTMLILPNDIKAQERLEVLCNKIELKTNEETECKIIAKDLDFIITGISLKIKISKNINIVSSNYNDKKWMMLDEEFNVKDINLINEMLVKEKNLEIATFKIKSNSSDKLKEKILLEDLLIGDEKYEKRKINIKNETIYINKKNINHKGYIDLILIGIIIFAFLKLKKIEV